MMRRTTLRVLLTGLILLLSLEGCLRAPRPIVGVLQGDHVWTGRVHLAGDVILAAGSRLTILPGTEVVFLPPGDAPGGLVEHPHFPGSELIVKGELFAAGKPDQPILFRAADPAAPAGSWGAINLEGSRESLFRYCVFTQADSAIHSRDSRVTIEESRFEGNRVGIRFHSSEILIEHNSLVANDVGIRFHFGAPVICENRFTDNRANLFVTAHPQDYRIENNHFDPAGDYQVILGEEVPEDVDLRRNYWPVQDLRQLETRMFDGRRESHLGRVLLDPMLTAPPRQAGPTWNR